MSARDPSVVETLAAVIVPVHTDSGLYDMRIPHAVVDGLVDLMSPATPYLAARARVLRALVGPEMRAAWLSLFRAEGIIP